jgi:hypothetical protein
LNHVALSFIQNWKPLMKPLEKEVLENLTLSMLAFARSFKQGRVIHGLLRYLNFGLVGV